MIHSSERNRVEVKANMTNAAQLPNSNIWMVRAGEGGRYADHFVNTKLVAIGWGEAGPIQPTDSDDEIRQRVAKAFPEERKGPHTVRRFLKEVKVGDAVTTYNTGSRVYHIGIIKSPPEWGDSVYGTGNLPGYACRVEWVCQVSRDGLSADAKNKLGGHVTVFQVSASASQELRLRCSGEKGAASDDAELPEVSPETEAEEILDTADILQEYIAQSDQFVEDAIAALGPYQLQDLVAGILRAMGYRTRVSSPGPDRGVDIFASPDGLGLSEPRIFVEVKHRAGAIGPQAIRTFTGGRQDSDRCLYVSTGGFSREARYEADRSRVPLTLLAMPDLRELLVNRYEDLDPGTRALVPLKRVYWPDVE